MDKPVVGMRVSKAEYEMIKSQSKESGMNDVSAYCRGIIRRELKERDLRSVETIPGTQSLSVTEDKDTQTRSSKDKVGHANSAYKDKNPSTDGGKSPGNRALLQSLPVTDEKSPDVFTSHLAKLERDYEKMRLRVDRLTSDLSIAEVVFDKSVTESLKTTLYTCDKMQTILDDTSESFHSAMEEIRTHMETVAQKMQLTFEQTTVGGLKRLKEISAALTGQIEKIHQEFFAKSDQMQQTGISILESQLKRFEEISREEMEQVKASRTLINDDLKGTRAAIEESLKMSTREFQILLDPAVSALRRFRIETLKFRKPVWLSAALTMVAISIPVTAWLAYKYETEKHAAEMWRWKAHGINQYVMENFYTGLDKDGKKKLSDYYEMLGLPTPKE